MTDASTLSTNPASVAVRGLAMIKPRINVAHVAASGLSGTFVAIHLQPILANVHAIGPALAGDYTGLIVLALGGAWVIFMTLLQNRSPAIADEVEAAVHEIAGEVPASQVPASPPTLSAPAQP